MSSWQLTEMNKMLCWAQILDLLLINDHVLALGWLHIRSLAWSLWLVNFVSSAKIKVSIHPNYKKEHNLSLIFKIIQPGICFGLICLSFDKYHWDFYLYPHTKEVILLVVLTALKNDISATHISWKCVLFILDNPQNTLSTVFTATIC